MPDQFDIDPARLGRYFAGDCSRAEAAAFDRWAQATPERQMVVAELRKVWLTGAASPRAPLDLNAAWEKIAAQLTDYHGTAVAAPLRVVRGGRTGSLRTAKAVSWRWLLGPAIAAVLTLAIGGGIWAGFVGRAAAPAEYASGTGQQGRRMVTLGEGTRVTLGPQSHLRVLGRGAAPREVELEGEAFFQVTHDPRHPFRVHTRGAETRVLGTEFLVRAYADDPEVRVAVRTGRVAVRSTSPTIDGTPDSALVTAGERAVVRGRAVSVDRTADSAVFAWVAGPVRFESATLNEVAREMGRWIGADIVVPGAALGATKVTVTFPDLSRDSVLARLANLIGAGAAPFAGRGAGLVPGDSSIAK